MIFAIRRSGSRARALQVLLIAGGLACAVSACESASAHSSGRWLGVVRDVNYDISLDTSRITRRWRNEYVVWYKTDHVAPHLHNGKPFNREIVQSLVRCDSLWFKVISVDMSLGNEKPISQQRADRMEVLDQPWRRVEQGAAEEIAARAACTFAERRFRGRKP